MQQTVHNWSSFGPIFCNLIVIFTLLCLIIVPLSLQTKNILTDKKYFFINIIYQLTRTLLLINFFTLPKCLIACSITYFQLQLHIFFFLVSSFFSLQDLHLSVKLEKFLDIALEIKEAEVQMIVASACKKVDKLVSFMKREIEEQLKNSKEKLREEIKQYRKVQVTNSMNYQSVFKI